MQYETIITQKEEHVGFLTLNRPDVFNRINDKMVVEVIDALKEFEKDSEVRVVVIKGVGEHFCAGIEVQRLVSENRGVWERLESNRATYDMENAIADFPKATVIAAQGVAMAVGAGILIRGDISIMEEDAQIAFNAINFGRSCLKGIRYLASIIGQKKALEMVLTGESWSAKDAERFGLINRVAPKGKLSEVAMEMAKLLASKSPLAVKFTKRANSYTRDMSQPDAQRFLNEHSVLLGMTEDAQEGAKAFLENREPVWKGR